MNALLFPLGMFVGIIVGSIVMIYSFMYFLKHNKLNTKYWEIQKSLHKEKK